MKYTHLESSEMYHIINVRVVLENLFESGLVCDINVVEFGSLAADKFDTIESFFGGIGQVVYNDDLVICLEKREGSERAYVTCTSSLH